MKHISLGGLDVSRIGLGTMAMSGYYLDPDSSEAVVVATRSVRHSFSSSR
jgi:aryl-alcohol dehydrogenase-like predicted oxidoreductase